MKEYVTKKIAFLTLLALIGLGIIMGWVPIPKLSVLPSNYEGPKPLFHAVVYNKQIYTQSDCHDASLCVMDTQLMFDPDDPNLGMGNLEGEETSMIVPQPSSVFDVGDFVPRQWLSDLQYFKNPVAKYEWDITLPNGSIIHYRMEEWVLKWYVSIEYGWDSDIPEGYVPGPGFPTTVQLYPTRYKNTQVWFKIMMNNMWYFENASHVYFGIAKIVTSKVKVDSMNPSTVDVTPESVGSYLPLYSDLPWEGGTQVGTQDASALVGKVLNPQVFRHAVYTRIILNDFGANVDGLSVPPRVQGDIITYEFNVHVFVVGDWVVKDKSQLPNDYGRSAKLAGGWFSSAVLQVLSNPLFWLIMTVAVMVILAVFAPSVLIALGELMSAIASRVRR